MKQRSTWLAWIAFLLAANACDSTPPESDTMPAKSAARAEPPYLEDANTRVMQMWSRSCALCHLDGNGGAPVVGDAAAWKPRLNQGEATLLQHTIEGYNNMPPLGYCMACERSDLVAMIDLMTRGMASNTPEAKK